MKTSYKLLNKNLSQKYDSIMMNEQILNNIDFVSDLSKLYVNEYSKLENARNRIFREKYKISILKNNEIIEIAKDIINSIDERYLMMFNELIDDKKLEIRENSCRKEGFANTPRNDDNDKKICKPTICLTKDYSYMDIMVLVHEFIHYVETTNKVMNKTYYFLGEFAAIYFEEYTWDYLISHGIETNKINSNYRIINTYDAALNYLSEDINYYKILNLYSKNMGLNENIYLDNYNMFSNQVNYDYFNLWCNKLLTILKDYSFYSHQYVVGTILAYYAKENVDIKDMIKYVDRINNKKTKNYKDFLKTIGIDLDNLSNDDLIKPTYNVLEKRIKLK